MRYFFRSLLIVSVFFASMGQGGDLFASPQKSPKKYLTSSKGGLFGDGQSREEKTKVLSAYFEPKPGSVIEVKYEEEKKLNSTKDILKLRGYIRVSPPPGSCFTITLHQDERDKQVCSTQTLSFRLGHINEDNGELEWFVKTGVGDAGTSLSWQTPHRLARVVKKGDSYPGPAKIFPIKGCHAYETMDRVRSVFLYHFSSDYWTFDLPGRDRLLPQPPKHPPLHYQAKRENIFASGSAPPPRASSDEEGVKELGPALTKKEEKAEKPWKIHPRDAYEMGVSFFKTSSKGGSPMGMKGKCRYQFSNSPDDPTSGRIECHQLLDYEFLYVHVPCLRVFHPR